MTILQETVQALQQLCRNSPRVELCGVIDSSGNIIPIRNVSRTPERCFVFSKQEYFKILSQGQPVRCIWHTHPGGSPEPSRADLEFVRMSKHNSLIISAKDYRWIEYKQVTTHAQN